MADALIHVERGENVIEPMRASLLEALELLGAPDDPTAPMVAWDRDMTSSLDTELIDIVVRPPGVMPWFKVRAMCWLIRGVPGSGEYEQWNYTEEAVSGVRLGSWAPSENAGPPISWRLDSHIKSFRKE